MKAALTGFLAIAILALGVTIGRASDKDETILNVQVSSADHEAEEGYFALGEEGTVMVKPGSELFRFLNRHRGQKVKIVLTQSERPQLTRIER